MRRLLDRFAALRLNPIFRTKDTPLDPRHNPMNTISYFSENRIDHVVNSIVLVIGITMLVAPMWILQAATSPKAKLGIITTFIILFLSLVSYATAAKPTEALGATAA